MKKIGFINPANMHIITLYYDEKASRNPYRIYMEYWNPKTCRKAKKQLERYADFSSCIYYISQHFRNYNEESR